MWKMLWRRIRSVIYGAPVWCGLGAYQQPEMNQKSACYKSTNRLLTSNMEKGKSRVKYARRRAFLDEWVGITDNLMDLDIFGNVELYQTVTVGRYLLRGCDSPDQTRHNDIEVREGRSPGISARNYRFESVCFLHVLCLTPMCTTLSLWGKRWQCCSASWKWLFRCIIYSTDKGTCSMEDVAGWALAVYATTRTSFHWTTIQTTP